MSNSGGRMALFNSKHCRRDTFPAIQFVSVCVLSEVLAGGLYVVLEKIKARSFDSLQPSYEDAATLREGLSFTFSLLVRHRIAELLSCSLA